ncbi:preprotein translocase subunit SecG [Paracoccus denitrificans]|uniref:preprotein translocase subunit SecG n=1 Tax=Paracoccus denitrificans TaxID=266 RepID=UPI001E308C45|nr:preprotein translocase subunit SecG [Paracoccus denitrificans]UFS67726.1 preprotein translocase subunit SecG [Paracoccus denitrificans]
MENIVLTVHLILAVLLIGVVLLQRSEGGGLGMGGGGGGVMTGRQAANALSRLTWIFAIGFIITSMTLTLIAAQNASSGSIVDQLNLGGTEQAPATALPGIGDYTPPPGAGQPVVPGAGQPVAPPAPAGETPVQTPAAPAEGSAPATAPVTPPPAEAPAQDAPAEAPATTPAPANN